MPERSQQVFAGKTDPPGLTRSVLGIGSSSLRAFVKLVTVSVLVLSLGLHWAVLQTVAWTGMLITFSRDASFKEAVAKTFGGKHPCSLCKAIKQGRAEETQQEQQQPNPVSKLDLGLVWRTTTFDFDSDHERIGSFNSSAISRAEEPPKPRPRGILEDNQAHA